MTGRNILRRVERLEGEIVTGEPVYLWYPKIIMGAPGELLRDTLDMLILKTVARGPMHGYAIAECIERTSGDALRVEEGALYPALHRLELRGWLSAQWGVSNNKRRARYYRLTAAGRKQ